MPAASTAVAAASQSAVERYVHETLDRGGPLDPKALAFLANLQNVAAVSPDIAKQIAAELADQRHSLKLIASENYSSLAVQSAMANWLTDKYAEGAPPREPGDKSRRFYAGCENVDEIEAYACARARELFGADYAYVQPHSGADANLVAFVAVLKQRIESPALDKLDAKKVMDLSQGQWNQLRQDLGNQRLLGMDLASGGHLTHGYRLNVSAMMFESYHYGVNIETGELDYDAIEQQAREIKPLLLVAGYSAHPKKVDFKRMRQIADAVDATFMVDMAHFSGLVAGGAFEGDYHPVKHAHIVTSTTHKTLRGPRGGIVLASAEYADSIDKGCPFVLGGPKANDIAAKAVCFDEALRPDFKRYAQQIISNAKAFAKGLVDRGGKVITGTTENHIVLLDVTPFGLTGRQAESALRACGVTLNRNAIPGDAEPWYTSGLRFGTPAVTTLGMTEEHLGQVADIVVDVLSATKAVPTKTGNTKVQFETEAAVVESAKQRVAELNAAFPLYPELDAKLVDLAVGDA